MSNNNKVETAIAGMNCWARYATADKSIQTKYKSLYHFITLYNICILGRIKSHGSYSQYCLDLRVRCENITIVLYAISIIITSKVSIIVSSKVRICQNIVIACHFSEQIL